MKILQVNNVYNRGSTGKITADLHKTLKQRGIESVVCYGRGDACNEDDVHKVSTELYSKFNNLLSRFTGIMYGGCFFSTNKLISIIKKEKPDIVHLQCINGYFVNIYRFVNWLKKHNIKTVVTLHAEFMHTANCGYAFECEKWRTGCGKCPRLKRETKSVFVDGTARSWQKMKKAFDGFKNENLIITSVSPWLEKRAEASPILAGKNHTIVTNGVDTNVFYCRNSAEIKSQLGIEGKKTIFHVTPSFNNDKDHIKGGYYIIKLAEMLSAQKDIKIVVAGPYASGLNVPENVMLLGNVKDQDKLAALYSMADVTVITSKKETFSMICAESLCCGTPVVGFEAGGPETITIPEYGKFVKYADIDALCTSVTEKLNDNINKEEISSQAHRVYSKEAMFEAFAEVYKELAE